MNYFKFVLFIVLYLTRICVLDRLGWEYLSVRCRDNDNDPLDWWYIYKPPTDLMPYDLSVKFSFITPYSSGRWEPSDKYITSNSMLQHTLAPIFRPTYTDHLAIAIYDERDSTVDLVGSTARGVLIADEMGGVWIYHTVPGLVNIKKDRPSFPKDENAKGHLLMCMSLDLVAANSIFRNLKYIYPKLTYFKIPVKLQNLLSEWKYFDEPFSNNKVKSYQFTTRGKSLSIEVLLRTSGSNRCLYKKFASFKNIVLDVYEHTDTPIAPICRKKYSVRNIQSISLKSQNNVLYINNETDRMRFAVSTAAPWQKLGEGSPQYWTCISNLDKDYSTKGGDLVCVENYIVWLTFDNFKVKEPECEN